MGYKDPEKQKEYLAHWSKETRERRRSEWFAANGPCACCGSWDDLELDHVDPATKVHHAVWTWGDRRREAELAKCQALCHGCHLAKSRPENIEQARGEKNGKAVLTRSQVAEIRARASERQIDLAEEYGVAAPTIRHILSGDTWA